MCRRSETLVDRVSQVLPEGCVLNGRYVIESPIGDGAMGAVYRAKYVALKVLHQSPLDSAKTVLRFEREAELARRLCHANIASVVDVGNARGIHYIAMELAPGEPLTHRLNDGPLAELRVIDLAQQLCNGLAHAHELGLIHRDLKPDNVIVEQRRDGRE